MILNIRLIISAPKTLAKKLLVGTPLYEITNFGLKKTMAYARTKNPKTNFIIITSNQLQVYMRRFHNNQYHNQLELDK